MAAGVETISQPLKYQTWVLKVFIHCEGCKKKVKKLLHSVYGVYTVDVDTKEQKVTVTGNVDSVTLIRKLEKSGKHVQLLNPSSPPKTPTKNNNQKPENQTNHVNPTVNTEQTTNQTVDNSNSNSNSNQKKVVNVGNQNSNSGNQQKKQQNKSVKVDTDVPVTVEDKTPQENTPDGGKKKKKKKGNNNNNNGGENSGDAEVPRHPPVLETNGCPANTESPPQQNPNPNPNSNPSPVNVGPVMNPNYNRVCEYPPGYYTPQPVYAVSYNTAHPSSSYTSSYYYSAPQPYSYAYLRQGTDVARPPPSDWNSNSSQSLDMFSDENPNACSLM